MGLTRTAFVAALACLAWQAAAQTLEIIPLKHRTAEQVLPVLQPLLEPGGTLTGQFNQIIVRASPRNLADIRLALEAIDRPLRRLQISVRFDDARERSREALSASGRIGSGGASVEARAEGSRRSARSDLEQRIQVLEGGRAFISTGQSRPISQGQIIQEFSSGFDVIPRLAGDSALLEIAPRREMPGAIPGSVQSQSAGGAVRARLGEWIELGGSTGNAARETSGIGAFARSSTLELRRVWLKVAEIGN